MKLFHGFVTAFSLYSAIPMPHIRWEKEEMQYALCFFPLIGFVIGAAEFAWYYFCTTFAIFDVLFAAVAVLLPHLISGAIHLDGFIDTWDAMASHAPPERRLEILKDPHVGAFGVIGCVGLFLIQFGLWHQLYQPQTSYLLPFVWAGYLISRCCNALSIACFPCAKSSGLVYAFHSAAARKAAVSCCLFYLLLAASVLLWIAPFWGMLLLVCVAIYFAIHRSFCIRKFGGNTGDLAGFLLVRIETLCLIAAVMGGVFG